VSNYACRFTGSLDPEILKCFERFTLLLEELFNVSLSSASFDTSGDLKQFCSGLIEGESGHPWRCKIRALSAKSRLGFAHSLFLFRKVVPQGKPQVIDYVRKLSAAQEEPDPHFMRFAIKMVRKLFPQGWDKTYVRHCMTSSLPLTSSSEAGRRDGGSRGWEAQLRWDRTDFCEYVLDSVAPRARGVSRVGAVLTGGKWRIIATPPRVDNALRPLHKAIYSHLSKKPWLLRGDAKPTKFKDFHPVEGEVFVSGDYESATDNLNSVLQRAILGELLSRSSSVPPGIRAHALETYSSVLTCAKRGQQGELFVQRRGQLMGQLTSFPLLCLVNYITFRYSIPRSVPVRINGDDIVFRATPKEFETWERNVAKGGLTLSKGKTLVHSRGFTLNSTPFWSSPKKGAVAVGFVRASAIMKRAELSELIQSLSSRFYSSCAGFGRERRNAVRRFFVDYNQKPIHASRRSLTRGLGMLVDRKLLHDVGLWHRELYYLGQITERPIPPLAAGELPDGWIMVGKSLIPDGDIEWWEREWQWSCTEHAWLSNFQLSELCEASKYQRIIEGCPPYGLGSLIGSRVRKMLKMTRSKVWKWVYSRADESVFGRLHRDRGSGVWVKVDQLASRSLVKHVNFLLGSGVALVSD